jgi:uncharacterized phage infection (PIP) family protein YhgE
MKQFLICAIAICAVACKTDQSATGDAAKQSMGLYAKGFNLLLKDPRELVDTYFRSIPEAGPTADAKPRLFPSQSMTASSIKQARDAFAEAKKSAPSSLAALAPASDRAMAAVDKVFATYDEAQKYYDAEGYKDDKLAKGKKLHADMMSAARELDDAIGNLEDGLSKIEDAQAADEVKDRAGNKDYGYWFRNYNLEAKKLLVAARDPKKIGDAFKAFEAVHTAFTEFVKGKGSDLASSFQPFARDADSFFAAATKLNRDAKDGADLREGRQSLVSAYNSLINMANSLYQVESAGALK